MNSSSFHSQKTPRRRFERLVLAGGSPMPSADIPGPVAGTDFSAPANVTIKATATVSNGAVTNVAFFAGATLLRSNQPVPGPHP